MPEISLILTGAKAFISTETVINSQRTEPPLIDSRDTTGNVENKALDK